MAAGVQASSTEGTSDSAVNPAFPAAVGPSTLSFSPQIDLSQNASFAPAGLSTMQKTPQQVHKKPAAQSIAQSAVNNFDTQGSDTSPIASDNRAVPVNQNHGIPDAGYIELSQTEASRLVPNPYVVVPQMELPGVASASGPAFQLHPVDAPRPIAEIATVASVPIPPELRFENVIRSNPGGSIELASRYGHPDSTRMVDYLIASAAGHADQSAVSQAVTFAEESGQAIIVSDPTVPLDNLQLTQLIAATTSARVQAWQSLFHSALDGAPAGPQGKVRTLHRPGVLMSGVDEGTVKDAVHATLISSLIPDFFGHRAEPPARRHASFADYLIATLTDAWEEAPEFSGREPIDPGLALLALAPLPELRQNNQAIVVESTLPELQSGLCLVPTLPIELAIDRLPATESVEWFIQMSNEPLPNEATQLQVVSADAATSVVTDADGQPVFADSASNPLPVDSQSFLGGGGGGGGDPSAAFTPGDAGYLPPQQFAVSAPVSFTQYTTRSSSHAKSSASIASLSTAMMDPTSSTMSLGIAVPLLVRSNAGVASPYTYNGTLPTNVGSYNVVDLNPGGAITSSQAVAVLGTESAGFIQKGTSYAHAAVWSSTVAASYTDINPSSSYSNSNVYAFSGSQFVGSAYYTSGQVDHAILWTHTTGTNYTVTDLNPSGYTSSYALATNGSRQFGYGYNTSSGVAQALLWNSVATSFVDLNPTGFTSSEILGANSTYEVGYGQFNNTNGGQLHALLWTGSSTAATDLEPTDTGSVSVSDSRAVAIAGTGTNSLIGGYGASTVTLENHALLWTGLSAANAVDLNPSGYMDSQVTAVGDNAEVGYGRINGQYDTEQALRWTGNAATFVDLNAYLPSNFTWAEAEGIDASGNVVGWALNSTTGQDEAVEWLAVVPEPSSLALMAVAAGFLATRRRRRNRPAPEQPQAV